MGDTAMTAWPWEVAEEKSMLCECAHCIQDGQHASSCAVHNEPAAPNGLCNCGVRLEVKVGPHRNALSDLDTYINFMDRHVRVRAFKNGTQIGTFSIVSDGTDLGAEISLQNGALYKIVVVGHPNTHDPIMTPEELANYLLTK
jgi:hypothetical protein